MGRIAIASPSLPLALPSLYLSAVPSAAGDRGSPHPCRAYGVARPAQRPDSTALGRRPLIRPSWPGAATRDENRVARLSSAFLGVREPVDKTDAGASRHHELLL